MLELGSREFPSPYRSSNDGRLRVVARRPDYDRICSLAYTELRRHGTSEPMVAMRLVESIGRSAERLTSARRAALLDQMDLILEDSRRNLANPRDIANVEEIARRYRR
jgi:uncharacterized membrane protein